jgi:uncharacterized membrane protein YhhN
MNLNLTKWLMDRLNASLILYFASGFLYLLSVIIGSENLSLIAKPIIIPSIVVFYFMEVRNQINLWFVVSLILFFVGDMFYLINDLDSFNFGLIFFLLAYLIALLFIFEDFKFLDKKRLISQINLSVIIVFFVLIYLAVTLLSILNNGFSEVFMYYLLFAIELFLMGVFTVFLNLAKGNRKNFFLILAVTSFIISDMFFVINKAIYGLLIFKIVSVFAQVISYYFYVKYMLERSLLKKI